MKPILCVRMVVRTLLWPGLLLGAAGILAAPVDGAEGASERPKAVEEPAFYRFRLTSGHGIRVCEAYTARLNATRFPLMPHCERPQTVAAAGFGEVRRVPLNPEEVLRLENPVLSFLADSDPEESKRIEAKRLAFGGRPFLERAAQRAADNQRGWIQSGRTDPTGQLPHRTRYSPPVDIDNDGHSDDVVMWKQGHIQVPCGRITGRFREPVVAPSYLLVLDAAGGLDVHRTREIFGHPMEPYGDLSSQPKRSKPTASGRQFVPIGLEMGVFSFEGTTYFDTFYHPTHGDLQGRRVGDMSLHWTLGVFKREKGQTVAVCEIEWQGLKSNDSEG